MQDAGHELRTPLTSLRTNIDTLRLHPDLVGEPRERLLDDLHSELRELSGLVDELVALAVDRYDNEPEQVVRCTSSPNTRSAGPNGAPAARSRSTAEPAPSRSAGPA